LFILTKGDFMLKIYGSPRTSAGRVYWMMEELGLNYERMPLNMSQREHKNPEFLKLNPNGKVPCLVDGDFVIWESMAITQYLAAKHNSPLLPKTAEETGLMAQWSYWSILEVQKHAVEWLIQVMFVPTERKDPSVIEKAQKSLVPLFGILDQALTNKQYLVSGRFTLADLHVASVVNVAISLGFDTSPYPQVHSWIKACQDRPAWHKVCSLPM
jgi:glutathione S-transferase